MNNNSQALEAVLFIYGEALFIKRAAKILNFSEEEVRSAAEELKTVLEDRGLTLLTHQDKLQLVTKPELAKYLEALVSMDLKESLTPSSLETLSIVSYAAPISRSEIDYIRGVNSSFTLRSLLLRGLIERTIDPKRRNAYIYNPSFNFLKHIGLSSIDELPEYERFQELIQTMRTGPEEVTAKEND